ncbi:MAG: 4-hydroxy-tetrahydrodipicolinate reductase [Clostridia bacterium]|jgi:4-hydroxy-tetrahydrodipicolinate reductase
MNILLAGCNGRMGQTITRICSEREDIRIAAGIDIRNNAANTYPAFSDIDMLDKSIGIDVVLDFSHPSGIQKITDYCRKAKKPLVYATTGLDEDQKAMLAGLSKHVPVFQSANMSLGINLLIRLCREAARFLGNDYNIEIIEKHHNQKVDAPSGTALKIADEINSSLKNSMEYIYDRHEKHEKRSQNEIGIHSVRGGTIIGQHEVMFAGRDEVITISHEATSRDILAQGALKAAQFIEKLPAGMYSMDDMMENQSAI